MEWATAIWEGNRTSFPSYNNFLRQFREVFEHSASGKEVGEELLALRQDYTLAFRTLVLDYTLAFRTLAAQTGWENDPLLNCSTEKDLTRSFSLNWPAVTRGEP